MVPWISVVTELRPLQSPPNGCHLLDFPVNILGTDISIYLDGTRLWKADRQVYNVPILQGKNELFLPDDSSDDVFLTRTADLT